MQATDRIDARLVTYSLGSCVGVVVYDPVVKVGGMLHAMLPDSVHNRDRAAERPFIYVDRGLPALFHAVYALGGVKERLVVKLAGGAELLEQSNFLNIGASNVEAVKKMLQRNYVKLAAVDTGGRDIRTLRLDIATGELIMDTVGKTPHPF
jgi:chemotaxis protein CheD